jgi:two-component system response regulator LytT
MDPLKSLIVDDDAMARTSLDIFCKKVEEVEVVGVCENALEARNFLKENEIDLLFLDVEMPGLTGVELVQTTDHLPDIIFISSRKEYAADAFEFQDLVVDFIPKPVSLPRLKVAIERALEKRKEEEALSLQKDYVFVRSEGRLIRIDLNDLQYVETVGDYVAFQTSKEKFMVHSTLSNIDKKLEHSDFLKVHRSYIVNLSKIVDIADNTIVIGKKVIPVSRAFRPILLKRINPL